MPLSGSAKGNLQNKISRQVPNGKSQASAFIEPNTKSKFQNEDLFNGEKKKKEHKQNIKNQETNKNL